MKHCFVLLFFVLISALSAQPSSITYQGVLTDDSGNLITGTETIRFDIYSAESGGSSLWNETHSSVAVNKGLFNVELGSATSFGSLDFSQELWLEITVDGTTLSPRIAFNSSGYAKFGEISTNIAGGAEGSIPYQTGDGTTTMLAAGTAGQVLTMNAGETAPEWVDNSSISNTLNSAQLLVGNSSNTAQARAVTGDITISNTGVTAIGSGKVTNSMLAGSIDDTKLSTISTSGKVSNSATTATSSNTANAIVARDASGNFSAGTITANLTGDVTGNLSGTADLADDLSGGVAGSVPYQTGEDATAMLAAGTAGQVLTMNAGETAPEWTTPYSGLTNFTESNYTYDSRTGVKLLATNAATNVDVVLQPKGTGAILGQEPDGLTAGGNKRGEYAVDWQTLRLNNIQVASGQLSVIAGGSSNTASGNLSFVGSGFANQATNIKSAVVGGESNFAFGEHSFIGGGFENKVSGYVSFVGGGKENMATGIASFIGGGFENTAGGDYATVGGGGNNTASGNRSFAGGGGNNTAIGDYATVSGGGNNTASGNRSFAGGGGNNTASGNRSFAGGGEANVASGSYSVVLGVSSEATADYSTAIGRDAVASASYSVAIGNSPTASGFSSLALGDFTSASGLNSNAFGTRTEAPSGYETVLGRFNTDYTPASTDDWNNTDRLFVIGNGTADVSRSNALTILKNANTTIGGSLTINANGTDASVSFPTGRGTSGQVLTSDGSGGTSWTTLFTGLTNFTESNYGDGTDINYGVKLLTKNDAQSNVDIVISPKGKGAKIAHQPDGLTAGGNKRGEYAVDWQTLRLANTQVASGLSSVISGGSSNTASGTLSSVAGGFRNIASGTKSFAGGGEYNTASGDHSTALGREATASNSYSVAIGNSPTASGFAALAMGDFTSASGLNSNAFGTRTTAPSGYETVIGRYNTDYTPASTEGWNTSDRLFVVGNGTSSGAKSNALTILKNSNTTIGGSLTINANGTDASVSFPTGRGTSGQFLKTNADGSTEWSAPAGLTNLTESNYTFDSKTGVKLLATNAATNVDLVIQPKGEGAILAQQPDGATAGGNNRGTYAVDLQMQRFNNTAVASGNYSIISGGYTNTASGNYSTVGGGRNNEAGGNDYATVGGGSNNTASGGNSFVGGGNTNTASGLISFVGGGRSNEAGGDYSTVGGGLNNTASGNYSTVGGGEVNTASGEFSVAGGRNAIASHFGEYAHAAGKFSSDGDAQTSVYVLRRNQTMSAGTWYDLYLDGNFKLLTIASGRTVTFSILITGSTSAGESAGYKIEGVIENVSGTTALVGTPAVTILGEDDDAWDARVIADDTNDALIIQVKGNGESLKFVARVETVEVNW